MNFLTELLIFIVIGIGLVFTGTAIVFAIMCIGALISKGYIFQGLVLTGILIGLILFGCYRVQK